MWRLRSYTFWFAVGLLALGLWVKDQVNKATLIGIAITNLGLREKTQRKVNGNRYN